MRLVEVDGSDESQLETLTRLVETVRAHDDPDAFPLTIEDTRIEVRYGADLRPSRFTLLLDDDGEAVGHFWIYAPEYDNRHVVNTEVSVQPGQRGRGYGTFLLEEVLRRTRALGRTTVWFGTPADDEALIAFLTEHGFSRASRDARRHQILADVDGAEIDRLEADATAHATDYVLERLDPPYDDEQLASFVAVTEAINDAPMGSLEWEEEVFDLDRLRDQERARELRGERFRRVVARHRETGELGGHTYLIVHPWDPVRGQQWDTAVAREHRGHRLGFALKIAMMRWLAEEEPQLEVIETWNNVDNAPMIRVNEALGYRLSREFAMFQRVLTPED